MRVVVADLEEEEGNYYDNGDGPEVDQLGAEDGGLVVCQHASLHERMDKNLRNDTPER